MPSSAGGRRSTKRARPVRCSWRVVWPAWRRTTSGSSSAWPNASPPRSNPGSLACGLRNANVPTSTTGRGARSSKSAAGRTLSATASPKECWWSPMSSDYERIRRDNIREYGEGTRHLDFLQRLYAERTHFIFELLQNAEDAHASQVTFVLDQQRLLVRHDGRLFNENDVRGICGVSASTKDDDLTDIGKFGIGFKSVYAYTTLPEVHSGEEHFRIRHYVRPEPAARPREPLNGQTLFVFPFDREDVPLDQAQAEITGGLRDLDPVTLLFLRHIHSVTLESADGTIHLTRTPSEADPNGVGLIRRVNGRVVLHQYWW